MSFGERLYQLRSDKNISQEDLAELLDVSRQSVSKWENDKAYPEMTKLLFMSDYFEVSLDYLMRGWDGESEKKDDAVYTPQNPLEVWNSFVSNLSSKQCKQLRFLLVIIVCACVSVIFAFMFGAGYIFGQLIKEIRNCFLL